MPPMIPTIKEARQLLNTTGFEYLFLVNDINYGVGLEGFLERYRILSLDNRPAVRLLRNRGVEVFSLEETGEKIDPQSRNTWQLLSSPKTLEYISGIKGGKKMLFFKNSSRMEEIARRYSWQILASGSHLSRYFENKLKLPQFLKEAGVDGPKSFVRKFDRHLSYKGLIRELGSPFVVQKGKGFGGSGTFFIKDEDDFRKVEKECRSRTIKIAQYLNGIYLTLNGCATRSGIVMSSPFFQITGLRECNRNEGGSCGTDWQIKIDSFISNRIIDMTKKIGEYIFKKGYRGIFGLDFVADLETKKAYLVEINPRLISSIAFFTKLQLLSGEVPLLAWHILEFLDLLTPGNEGVVEQNLVSRGGQLILHNLEDVSCSVNNSLETGIYRWEDNRLTFLREAYSVEECKAKREFLILPYPQGRIIKSRMECARIQTLERIIEDDWSVRKAMVDLAGKIYEKLALRPSEEEKM